MVLHIRLLGGFQLFWNQEALHRQFQGKQQSLLAYLILHRHWPQNRQHLAYLYWPDAREARSRAYLRRELSIIRRELPNVEQYLSIENQTIQWRSEASFTLDLIEIDKAIHKTEVLLARNQPIIGEMEIEPLLQYCQVELLPGFYDDWIVPLRTQLKQQICNIVEKLVFALEAEHQYNEAIQLAQQLLNLNPFHEPHYRHLMRLYILTHNHAAAMQLFRECEQMLATEFNAPLSAETVAVHAQISQHQHITEVTNRQRSIKNSHQFVGRHNEWQQLRQCWQKLTTGQAHLILISGDAGIGKTRLAEEFLAWGDAQNILTAAAHAYAAEGSLPYGAIVDLLRTPHLAAHLSKIAPVWQTLLARLLPDLAVQQTSMGLFNSEQWLRRQLFEALVQALLVSQQPLLIHIDDLHWVDVETLEWLHFLLRLLNRSAVNQDYHGKIIIVGTVRDEEITAEHPLTALLLALRPSSYLTELSLAPFNEEESIVLGEQLVNGPLSSVERHKLYQFTQGNPLFIVECIRSRREQLFHFDNPQLPPKVQAVIELRLAQLSPLARQLADLAAVIGGDFDYQLLIIAVDQPEENIVAALNEICSRRILQINDRRQYDFTHDRLREVAYDSLSPQSRRLLHRRVALGLELTHRTSSEVSGQLALHLAMAGEHQRAFEQYVIAGNGAREIYAVHQVIHYFERALEALQMVASPKTSSYQLLTSQELQIQVALGAAHLNVKGYASQAAEQAYLRALTLGERLGAQRQLFDTFWGLHEIYLFRAQHDKALAMSTACMQIAETLDDPALLLQAHHALFGTHMMTEPCDLFKTFHHASAAIELYDPINHHDHTFQYGGHDPYICAHQIAAKALWLLGYPKQAMDLCKRGLATADSNFSEEHYPLNLVFARRNFAEVYMYCGVLEQAVDLMDQRNTIAKKFDLVMYVAQGNIFQGWIRTHQRQVADGVRQIELGVQQWVDLGIIMEQTNFYRMLAECYLVAEQYVEGLAALDQAIDALHRGGGQFYEAEIYRVRGKILAAQAAPIEQIEMSYQQAVSASQSCQAKSLELRAVMDLSELWFEAGLQQQAIDSLQECYGWFSEGFGTADLRRAEDLLYKFTAAT